MPSIYCFKLKGKYNDKNIYKFGKTNQSNAMKRINSYSGLNKPDNILLISYVKNSDLLETKILEELRNNYEFIKDLGKEYFYCDDEINLHKFIKEMEIKYYNFEENEEEEEEEEEKSDESNNDFQIIRRNIKPINFKLNGIVYNLSSDNSSWRELILKFLKKILNILDINLIEFENQLIQNFTRGRFRYENIDTMRFGKKIIINSNLYIELNMTRKRIIKICQKIAELNNIDFKYTTNEN